MNAFKKRSYSREENEAPILILTKGDFASCMKNRPCYISGQMRNCDKGGMYFESSDAIQPGSNISIKMVDEHASDDDWCSGVYRVHYARVIWCKEIDRVGGQCYGIGAQILETVVQAEIH